MLSLETTDYINIAITAICLYIITHKQTSIVKQLVDDKVIRTICLISFYYISRKNVYISLLLSTTYFILMSHYSNVVFTKNE
jgi:hypothetical protein